MDERTFEIVLSRYPEGLLPEGWSLEGQQIGVAGGTLDLLFRDRVGVRHVVELKKGPATLGAAQQVLRYARALEAAGGGRCVPWVVAHAIPETVARSAAALGVRTLAIPPEACERVLAGRGVRLADLVPMRRRTPGALTGGAGDVWSAVSNDEALAEMPAGMAALLRSLAARADFALNSGRMQTIIRYRGVKLGGVNRKNQPHGYLTGGVLATQAERQAVLQLGFRWMEKHQAGKVHVHTWFQIPIQQHAAFARGLELARAAVERSLGALAAPAKPSIRAASDGQAGAHAPNSPRARRERRGTEEARR